MDIKTADYKITELFCVIDEFCKHFEAENAGKLLLGEDGVKRRRRKASLSDSEIMTILLFFHFGTFHNFKHYYLFFIKGTLKSSFPDAVSYNRFVELESRVFFPLMFFLNLRAFGRCTGITFVDSTMIPVCHNLRRYANKVFKGIATDGRVPWGGVMASNFIWHAMTEGRLLPLCLLVPMSATRIQKCSRCWLNVCMASCSLTRDTFRKSYLISSLKMEFNW